MPTPTRIKTEEELDIMRQGARILKEVHDLVRERAVDGAILKDLDRIAEHHINTQGGRPAFKGFRGFPTTLCTMINSEIVHGIPDNRKLHNGDLFSVDCGVIFKGLITDAAFTMVVGGEDKHPQRARFSACVYQALQAGCQAAKAGNRIGDIGAAIQQVIQKGGYQLVREFTGHGVGDHIWEDPHIFNYGKPGKGALLKENMTICIEPIVSMGAPQNKTLRDGWTVVTLDGRDACQWEHCGIVTKTGLEILV